MVKSNEAINIKRMPVESEDQELYLNAFNVNNVMAYSSFMSGFSSEYLLSPKTYYTTRVIHKTAKRSRSYSDRVPVIIHQKLDHKPRIYVRAGSTVKKVFFPESEIISENDLGSKKDDVNFIIQKPRNVLFYKEKEVKGNLSFPEKVSKSVLNNEAFLTGLELEDLETNIEYIAKNLTKINPDKIQFELTEDKSIYYSLIKGKKIILFDHYLKLADTSEELEGDNINAVYSIYESQKILERFEGGSMEALEKLQLYFQD